MSNINTSGTHGYDTSFLHVSDITTVAAGDSITIKLPLGGHSHYQLAVEFYSDVSGTLAYPTAASLPVTVQPAVLQQVTATTWVAVTSGTITIAAGAGNAPVNWWGMTSAVKVTGFSSITANGATHYRVRVFASRS